MKTRLFLLTIAILFAIASPNVFGQSADNPETVKYSIGSYAPIGDFGAYLEENDSETSPPTTGIKIRVSKYYYKDKSDTSYKKKANWFSFFITKPTNPMPARI